MDDKIGYSLEEIYMVIRSLRSKINDHDKCMYYKMDLKEGIILTNNICLRT